MRDVSIVLRGCRNAIAAISLILMLSPVLTQGAAASNGYPSRIWTVNGSQENTPSI